jgi:hypothetical protein
VTRPALTLVQNLVDENGELAGCPHCRETLAECEVWERRVVQLEQQLKRALEDKDAKLLNDKHYPAAIGLIQEWKRECGHPNSSETDPKRVRLALSVVKRYKGDDGRAKLSLVIQQGKHLAYVDPDTGFKYDEFGRLFGCADEIEKRATQFYLWCKRHGLDPANPNVVPS